MDFVWICTEHSAFNLETVVDLVTHAHAAGITPIVRISDLQYEHVTRLLESGCQSLILPHIKSSAEVRRFIELAKYYRRADGGGHLRGSKHGLRGDRSAGGWRTPTRTRVSGGSSLRDDRKKRACGRLSVMGFGVLSIHLSAAGRAHRQSAAPEKLGVYRAHPEPAGLGIVESQFRRSATSATGFCCILPRTRRNSNEKFHVIPPKNPLEARCRAMCTAKGLHSSRLYPQFAVALAIAFAIIAFVAQPLTAASGVAPLTLVRQLSGMQTTSILGLSASCHSKWSVAVWKRGSSSPRVTPHRGVLQLYSGRSPSCLRLPASWQL